jgi:hypothetical protein
VVKEKTMKNLLMLLFLVRVTIPAGTSVVYKNVETVWPQNGYYRLDFTDGRHAWVPMEWAVIEEVK